jgi:hypothetical protein
MFLAAGCFDPPPEYSVPVLVPPIVDVPNVDPPTTTVKTVNLAEQLPFEVPFHADDGGEEMWAYFVEDIPSGDADPRALLSNAVRDPPNSAPFDEQKRSISWVWTVAAPTGCHTVTMILSRKSNFGTGLYQTTDELQTARVSWFLDIRDPSAATPSAVCGPFPTPVSP